MTTTLTYDQAIQQADQSRELGVSRSYRFLAEVIRERGEPLDEQFRTEAERGAAFYLGNIRTMLAAARGNGMSAKAMPPGCLAPLKGLTNLCEQTKLAYENGWGGVRRGKLANFGRLVLFPNQSKLYLQDVVNAHEVRVVGQELRVGTEYLVPDGTTRITWYTFEPGGLLEAVKANLQFIEQDIAHWEKVDGKWVEKAPF